MNIGIRTHQNDLWIFVLKIDILKIFLYMYIKSIF